MDANLLQYFKNIHQNPPTDLIDKFNSQEKIHLLKNVFPCFFTGNLGLKNPFVTISLNPKYDDAKIKDQGTDFEIWINNCSEKGFSGYEDDKKLHLIWKNLAKVFFSEEDRKTGIKNLLHKNLVNIDWCYYYSEKFPTLKENNSKPSELFNIFNDNTIYLLDIIKPKAIFIHGKSLCSLFNFICDNINNEVELKHGDKPYNILSGNIKGTKVPVIYQEWFINRGNMNDNLNKVREIIQKKLLLSSL